MQLESKWSSVEKTNVKFQKFKKNNKNTDNRKEDDTKGVRTLVFDAKRVQLSTFNGHFKMVCVCVLKKFWALYI